MKFDPGPAERRLRIVACFSVALFSGVALFWSVPRAMSVLAGGVASVLNMEALVIFIRRVTSRAESGLSRLDIVGLGARYLLLGLSLFVIFSVWRVDVVALTIGLSAPVAAVCFEWGLLTIREFGAGCDTEH